MSNGGHALFSPSSASRGMACAGWLALARARGVDAHSTNAAANYGVVAHKLTEHCQILGVGADTLPVGTIIDNVLVDEKMIDIVSEYLDFVDSCRHSLRGNLLLDEVEYKVPIQVLTGEPGAEGTIDKVLVSDEEIYIIDLKTGGNRVKAFKCTQLIMYALGTVFDQGFTSFPDTPVHICIVQPSVLSEPDVWSTTVGELLMYVHPIKKAANNFFEALTLDSVEDILPYLNPTEDGCKWCPNRGRCEAQDEIVFAAIDVDVPNHDDLATKAKHLAVIEQYVKDVSSILHTTMISMAEKVPGFKVVRGRAGNLAFKEGVSPDKLFAKNIHKEIYKQVMLTPTQLLAKVKKGFIPPKYKTVIENSTFRPEGSLKVVPETHEGKAIDLPTVGFDAIQSTDE